MRRTAAAILQLAEQHKLSVEAPISQYYPDAPPTWPKITLKNLLTHTSGPYLRTAGHAQYRGRFARYDHPEIGLRL